jgi:hypothetical protein
MESMHNCPFENGKAANESFSASRAWTISNKVFAKLSRAWTTGSQIVRWIGSLWKQFAITSWIVRISPDRSVPRECWNLKPVDMVRCQFQADQKC